MLLVDDLAAGGTKNLRHTPRGLVTLSKPQNNFAISRGFYFRETSHPKFRENKTLAKISEFTVVAFIYLFIHYLNR